MIDIRAVFRTKLIGFQHNRGITRPVIEADAEMKGGRLCTVWACPQPSDDGEIKYDWQETKPAMDEVLR